MARVASIGECMNELSQATGGMPRRRQSQRRRPATHPSASSGSVWRACVMIAAMPHRLKRCSRWLTQFEQSLRPPSADAPHRLGMAIHEGRVGRSAVWPTASV